MCELTVKLPDDQLAPFCRALMRVEAELLVADAVDMVGIYPDRTTNEREADAFLLLLKRICAAGPGASPW